MANNSTIFNTIPNTVLLASVVFKCIVMIVGVLGNVTVIIHTIFLNRRKTATSYLIGNLALADLLVCLTLYPIWTIEFIQTLLNIDSNQELFCKLSHSTTWSFMFVSIATLLAITVDRYIFIVKPLRYPQIVTQKRVSSTVSGIWVTACWFFVFFINLKDSSVELRSFCYIPDSIFHLMDVFVAYLPLNLIFLLNFHILFVARKQRKRIFAETAMTSVDNSTEETGHRMSFALRFFVALKAAKTFIIVFVVLTFCILTPTVVGRILYEFYAERRRHFWYVVFHYEFYGINSVVNAFIYGMRCVKHRKVYLQILVQLLSNFSCHKANN